ncbi:tetratricopeptide repeat protein [Ascidiimonas sp. W6]|uniref:tetratricopeptide repeat protein n=1 Tax=Ascidiimonas meishanensis TaxID=3128903 RepID=UPI0030EDEEDB
MKRIINLSKIIFSVLLLAYTGYIVYFLFMAPKEERYNFAAHMQGNGLSQAVFQILIKEYPEDARNYFEMSVPHNKRGDFTTGFSLLNKAVALNPKAHHGYRGYMKLRFLRDYEGALTDFSKLDSLTPNFVDAPWGEDIDFLRGECYYGLKQYELAITAFQQSLQNQKEDWADVQTFVFIGLCKDQLDKTAEAVTAFETALKYAQTTCEAHVALGRIYVREGNLEKARFHLEQATKTLPYKRDDYYKEYLNEVYKTDIEALRNRLVL